jgi:hypothetical protein
MEVCMKRFLLLYPVFALILSAIILQPTFAQEKKRTPKKLPSQEEMMKRWQDFMTPGDAHKKLEALVGTWDAEVKSWVAGPKSEPNISKGIAEYKMSLGGRYLLEEVSAEMMGQPMSGVGYTGYDNFKKKYVGFWVDNMGTGMLTMEGTLDKDGKSITMWGRMDEPTTGEKDKKVKYVTRIIDADKHMFEMYDLSTWGDKNPVMEITYTRKKS